MNPNFQLFKSFFKTATAIPSPLFNFDIRYMIHSLRHSCYGQRLLEFSQDRRPNSNTGPSRGRAESLHLPTFTNQSRREFRCVLLLLPGRLQGQTRTASSRYSKERGSRQDCASDPRSQNTARGLPIKQPGPCTSRRPRSAIATSHSGVDTPVGLSLVCTTRAVALKMCGDDRFSFEGNLQRTLHWAKATMLRLRGETYSLHAMCSPGSPIGCRTS